MPAIQTAPHPPIPVEELIDGLSRPEAYPHPVDHVDVIQTHASVVFLAGDQVYKVKKPLDLGFLDYSTLERRRACCEAEVTLDRRLAPDVYLGVVPIVRDPALGHLRVGGTPAAALEWAVHMRRLHDEDTLLARVTWDQANAATLEALGRRLAAFHQEAGRGPQVARWATFEVVAANCRDNLAALRPLVGVAVSATVLDRLARLTEQALERLRPRIEARAARACEGHGDLRLEHVYLPAHEGEPLRIVDGVEFSERLRCLDPAADVAFLLMELEAAGRPDLAGALAEAWVHASGDEGARPLLPFYVAYRALVRAKVDGIAAAEPEVPEADRARARVRARARALLALATLAPPRHRPCLVLLCGLPGTGKSSLALALARAADLEWVRADEVRRELARAEGLATSRGGAWAAGAYAPGFSDRVYARCRALAEAAWFEGRRVVVDACFASEGRRRELLVAASDSGTRALLLHLTAPPDVARHRLDERGDDVSDADRSTYDRMAAAWEPFGAATLRRVRALDAGLGREATLAQALGALRAEGLVDS